ncbi:zf-HC2 domain-containing protein [Streptomyces griseoluteus]|uniref:zf-HC2 domain-containing protein n=1 Tax=Streptomyces griseoluteus TaxID=29306 RepID=UPI0036F540FB
MLSSSQDCRNLGDLLQGHALNVLHPDETGAIRAHLTTCPYCRDEHHCLAAVPEHLALLRKALAHDPGRQQPSYLPSPSACRQSSQHRRRRHGAARGTPATSLTLSQWVSRLACVR